MTRTTQICPQKPQNSTSLDGNALRIIVEKNISQSTNGLIAIPVSGPFLLISTNSDQIFPLN